MTVINPDVWNSLPKHLQDLLIDSQIELEAEGTAYFEGYYNEVYQFILDQGMVQTKWSKADEEWFRNLAYDAAWAKAKEDISPDMYTKLVKLLGK